MARSTSRLVAGLDRRLEPGQRRGGAARARLAVGLGLEARPAGERAGEVAGVEIGQEAAVQVAALAHRAGVLLGDRPADVVVAAHVGQPARAARDRRHRAQRMRHERHAPRGQRAPQQDHEHVVVGEVALLALVAADAEVGDELARRDDRLGLERQRRARRSAAARGRPARSGGPRAGSGSPSPALPEERHGVQAHDVDADGRQRQHDLRHRDEDLGVGVVEVPLVGVERRPHPAPQLGLPGEVAGGVVGKDLRQRRLVGVRHSAILEGPVEGELALVAGQRGLRPGVLARGVVDDDVDAQRHALGAQTGGQAAQVVHRPERGLDGAVVGDRVAAVVRRGPRAQERHEMQIGDAQLAQVGQALAHALQRPGEAVDVGDVADGVLAVQPVRA